MQCTRRAHAVRMQCACSAHRGDVTRHAQANLRHGARRTTSASIAQPPSEKRERTVPKSANGASCAARRRRSSSSAVSGSPPLPLPSQLSSSVASASATAAVPGWERKGSRVGAERWSEAELKQSSSTGRPNSVRFDSYARTMSVCRVVLRARGLGAKCSTLGVRVCLRLALDLAEGGRLAARASRAHDGDLELPLLLSPAQPRVASCQRALRAVPVLIVEGLLTQHPAAARLDALPKGGRIARGKLSLHLNRCGAGHAASGNQRGSEQQRAQRGGGRSRQPHREKLERGNDELTPERT
eukprot:scaffold49135_cov76-Phaeocystis_antarctica.AAC.2